MDPEIQKIFDRFTADFNSIYIHMSGKQRKEIAYLAPTLFIRWYYSALFSETILSPSAIAESQEENIVKDRGFYSFCSHFGNISGDAIEFSFTREFYSISEHPVYKDIETFINFIEPVLYLNPDSTLKENDIHSLQRRLSVSDRYYANYIFCLAEKLGLYKKMPSLFETCIQPEYECVFFSLKPSEKFKYIFDASLKICSEILNSDIPYDLNPVEPETLKSFLENPMTIDDMFINLYSGSGIDIDDVWKRAESSELDENDSSVLSSIFYMGLLMDRAFIYIFGHYLRLIRPLYSYPISFREIINSLFTTIAIDGERELELFMPCTSYVLTPLGRLFFNNRSTNKLSPIPADKVNLSLDNSRQINIFDLGADLSGSLLKTIYTLKASFLHDTRLWKIVEMESGIPVDLAANYLLTMFLLPQSTQYKIKLKGKNKKETIYIPFKNSKDTYNPALLSDLLHDGNTSIIFEADKNQSLELKFIDEHSACREIIYPRIIKQSKELTEHEHNIYSYD